MHIKITDFNILCVLQITEFIYGNNLLKSLGFSLHIIMSSAVTVFLPLQIIFHFAVARTINTVLNKCSESGNVLVLFLILEEKFSALSMMLAKG